MSYQPRIVPFQNQAEFELIYKNLYSNSEVNKTFAVSRINVWRTRGRLPHSIDSTSYLTESLLSLKDGNLSKNQKCLQLSMSFIRFLNGLVDSKQKSFFAQSLSSIANEIGLPSWFVELRHTATHDKLPNLEILKNGCESALNWLDLNYWKLQFFEEYDVEGELEFKNLLIVNLKRYKDLRKVEVESGMEMLGKETLKNNVELLSTLQKKIKTEKSLKVLIKVLLTEKGFLIPVSKKKRGSELKINLKSIWLPLLRQFQQKFLNLHFEKNLFFFLLDYLNEELVKLDSGEADGEKFSFSFFNTVVTWGKEILSFFIIPSEELFQECLETIVFNFPNSHCLIFLKFILTEKKDLESKVKNNLISLIKVYELILNSSTADNFKKSKLSASIPGGDTLLKKFQNYKENLCDYNHLDSQLTEIQLNKRKFVIKEEPKETINILNPNKKFKFQLVKDFQPSPIGTFSNTLNLSFEYDGDFWNKFGGPPKFDFDLSKVPNDDEILTNTINLEDDPDSVNKTFSNIDDYTNLDIINVKKNIRLL